MGDIGEHTQVADWDVEWDASGARGPGKLWITLGAEFNWPGDDYVFRVSLARTGHRETVQFAHIHDDLRAVTLPVDFPLSNNPRRDRRNERPVFDATRFVETDGGEDFNLLEFNRNAIDDRLFLERLKNGYNRFPPHPATWQARVVVELLFKGEPLEGELEFLPAPKELNWNHVIIDPRSFWYGWLPIDAVDYRLRQLLTQLAESFSHLSAEFLIFSSFINTQPSRVRVECDISGGRVAAEYDYQRREFIINGTSFLCRPDALLKGVLLHETSHAIDHNRGQLESNLKLIAYAELVDSVEEARLDMIRAEQDMRNGSGDLMELRQRFVTARDRYNQLRRQLDEGELDENQIQTCIRDGRVERIQSECRALFFVLERRSGLGNPAESESVARVMIEAMVAQLMDSIDTLSEMNPVTASDPLIQGALKDCFRRMIDWLNQPENERIRHGFAGDRSIRSGQTEDNWAFLETAARNGYTGQ